MQHCPLILDAHCCVKVFVFSAFQERKSQKHSPPTNLCWTLQSSSKHTTHLSPPPLLRMARGQQTKGKTKAQGKVKKKSRTALNIDFYHVSYYSCYHLVSVLCSASRTLHMCLLWNIDYILCWGLLQITSNLKCFVAPCSMIYSRFFVMIQYLYCKCSYFAAKHYTLCKPVYSSV